MKFCKELFTADDSHLDLPFQVALPSVPPITYSAVSFFDKTILFALSVGLPPNFTV
jgi:hypothetical protein